MMKIIMSRNSKTSIGSEYIYIIYEYWIIQVTHVLLWLKYIQVLMLSLVACT